MEVSVQSDTHSTKAQSLTDLVFLKTVVLLEFFLSYETLVSKKLSHLISLKLSVICYQNIINYMFYIQ